MGAFFGMAIGTFRGCLCCCVVGVGCSVSTLEVDDVPFSTSKSTRSCFFFSFESSPRSLNPESLMSCFRSTTFMDSKSDLLGIEEGGVASDMNREKEEGIFEALVCR